MQVREFFEQIRANLKDAELDARAKIPSEQLGRATLAGIRRLQTLFPEARLAGGRGQPLADKAYTETTAGQMENGSYPVIPLPAEFEAALEAYVMAWAFGLDSMDIKDESLARHWHNRFADMAGLPRA